jgi:hypothetical protein
MTGRQDSELAKVKRARLDFERMNAQAAQAIAERGGEGLAQTWAKMYLRRMEIQRSIQRTGSSSGVRA